ncbi:MAG: glycoside hydrolase family 99-like domain-containing protein [Thermoguttaceae bacterium]
MMNRPFAFCFFLALVCCLIIPVLAPTNLYAENPVHVGAYYFDGWSGEPDEQGYTYHIRERLVKEFADREPIWGWRSDTLEIMESQIDYASQAGLEFFSFCWYYPEDEVKEVSINNALELFLKASNREKLQFCLLIANHAGFRVGPKEWDVVCEKWVRYFKESNHQTVDGKPLLIFFSSDELLKSFGSPAKVNAALEQLRERAKQSGLPGVSIAGCVWPNNDLTAMKECGFDVFTGYNYPGYNISRENRQRTFDELLRGDQKAWNDIAQSGATPYIPVVTVGWDMRAWESADQPPGSYYFEGRSPKNVAQAVQNGMNWVREHSNEVPKERLVLLYAWNENGEGGYLTPTKKERTAVLDAVEKIIKGK